MLYSEEGKGPEALVFEVVFPPGDTPNILLEESQPGNKVCALYSMISDIGHYPLSPGFCSLAPGDDVEAVCATNYGGRSRSRPRRASCVSLVSIGDAKH